MIGLSRFCNNRIHGNMMEYDGNGLCMYMYVYIYIYMLCHLVMTNIAMENHHAFNRSTQLFTIYFD